MYTAYIGVCMYVCRYFVGNRKAWRKERLRAPWQSGDRNAASALRADRHEGGSER